MNQATKELQSKLTRLSFFKNAEKKLKLFGKISVNSPWLKKINRQDAKEHEEA